MLYLITAKPRIGKTLHAVKILEDLREQGHYLITNIDGYKGADEHLGSLIGHEVTQKLLERDWETFAEEISPRKIVITLDEAQRVVGTTGIQRATQSELFYFFEYHGHWGMDIYLISQNYKSLHQRITDLIHEVHKVSKVKTWKGHNKVKVLDTEVWEQLELITYDPKPYYDKYITSHSQAGKQKPRTPLGAIIKTFGIWGIVALIAFGFMIYVISGYILDSKGDEVINEEQKEHYEASNNNSTNIVANEASKVSQTIRGKSKRVIDYEQQKKEEEENLKRVWTHEIFEHTFNAVTCEKRLRAWACKNKRNRLHLSYANMSECNGNICTYYFNFPQTEDEKRQSVLSLPSASDFTNQFLQNSTESTSDNVIN